MPELVREDGLAGAVDPIHGDACSSGEREHCGSHVRENRCTFRGHRCIFHRDAQNRSLLRADTRRVITWRLPVAIVFIAAGAYHWPATTTRPAQDVVYLTGVARGDVYGHRHLLESVPLDLASGEQRVLR